MIRKDLLALTNDDLAIISNKGLVKRAQQEIQANQLTFELSTTDQGAVTVVWSDEVRCLIPANASVKEGRCNCPATTICRHIIRSVLLYQQVTAEQQNQQNQQNQQVNKATKVEIVEIAQHEITQVAEVIKTPKPAVNLPQPWNPGDISDEEISKFFSKNNLAKLEQHFDKGHVLELVKSIKPTAYFYTLACSLRFLVPYDLRYTHCDCAEQSPCSHVVLAIWAFRLFRADQVSGIVSTRKIALPIPTNLLDEIESTVSEFIGLGIANIPKTFIDRFRRLEARLRLEKLIWPAEIIAELIQQYKFYTGHNASFSVTKIVDLIGELCIRSDAIRNDINTVPQLFVRGSDTDKLTDVSSARLIGVGCGVKVYRGVTEVSAYLQDVDSGVVVAMSQTFNDPAKDSKDAPKPFWQLSQNVIVKGNSLGKVGASQILIKGGKRTSSYQLIPGRAQINVNPQAFNWDALRAPLLAEDFSEIRARFSNLPPAALRPRRIAENLQVCRIKSVEELEFSTTHQIVRATLFDQNGNTATLIHPFAFRGHEGVEKLLSVLSNNLENLHFISGEVYFDGSELIINPIALVFEQDSSKFVLQPWIDRTDTTSFSQKIASNLPIKPVDLIVLYITEVKDALGELFLLGLNKADSQMIAYWQQLSRKGLALGLLRFTSPITKLAAFLAQKNHELNWQYLPPAQVALELAVFINLAQ